MMKGKRLWPRKISHILVVQSIGPFKLQVLEHKIMIFGTRSLHRSNERAHNCFGYFQEGKIEKYDAVLTLSKICIYKDQLI